MTAAPTSISSGVGTLILWVTRLVSTAANAARLANRIATRTGRVGTELQVRSADEVWRSTRRPDFPAHPGSPNSLSRKCPTPHGENGRVLYRCAIRQNRALADDFPEHPSSLYVREDAILGPLDDWIASIRTPAALENHQNISAPTSPARVLAAQLAEIDRKIGSLVAAEAGANVPQFTDQLNRRGAERQALKARFTATPQGTQLTKQQMSKALAKLGGIPAVLANVDPLTRENVYRSSGIRPEYGHIARRISTIAAEAGVLNRVRRGT